MTFQSGLVLLLAALALLHFARGVWRDLAPALASSSGACGGCASGGCPVNKLERLNRP